MEAFGTKMRDVRCSWSCKLLNAYRSSFPSVETRIHASEISEPMMRHPARLQPAWRARPDGQLIHSTSIDFRQNDLPGTIKRRRTLCCLIIRENLAVAHSKMMSSPGRLFV
jgi:hypothetical protein